VLEIARNGDPADRERIKALGTLGFETSGDVSRRELALDPRADRVAKTRVPLSYSWKVPNSSHSCLAPRGGRIEPRWSRRADGEALF
jgi:hypothetical protein